jgi:hypothetical protein
MRGRFNVGPRGNLLETPASPSNFCPCVTCTTPRVHNPISLLCATDNFCVVICQTQFLLSPSLLDLHLWKHQKLKISKKTEFVNLMLQFITDTSYNQTEINVANGLLDCKHWKQHVIFVGCNHTIYSSCNWEQSMFATWSINHSFFQKPEVISPKVYLWESWKAVSLPCSLWMTRRATWKCQSSHPKEAHAQTTNFSDCYCIRQTSLAVFSCY